jgi:hypothetical protein
MNVTSQRRAVRRVCCLATFGLLVAALLLVPAATARAAATFVSKRYGYSIAFPGSASRWSYSLATVNLLGSATAGAIHSSQTDVFTDAETQRLYILASRPNQPNLQKWAKFVISIRDPSCGAPHALPNATLAGARALAFTWSCSIGRLGFMIAALHAGRGYFMLVASPTNLSRASDLRAFDAARRSFRFLHT